MLLKYFLTFLVGLIFIFGLSGCQIFSDGQAPVIEGFSKPAFLGGGKKKSGDYRVKRGDTLYSIAWANNLDYRTLAEMNQLHAPYRIYAGQFLRTRMGFFESIGHAFKRDKKPALASAKSPQLKSTPQRRWASKKDARYEVMRPQKMSEPRQTFATRSPRRSIPVKGWKWPADGRVVQGYSSRAGGNKGIDIAGHYGESVRAAASGKVVYSGSGLKGYGQLLLIKHNNSYLSAYAHNKRLLVREGDQVAIGQKIAEMGRANHGMVRLHFEIRQNGQPVDPMIYLASGRKR